ncbi:hypothetical protein EYC84_005972 [Monilinia fructicola]|uniref:Uncharacterized protein n=1 Tax=Monilinia fructicola TaxID=38448 RepID=A0A5M9JYA2_MONFR|nr:hypothetical protein EYC84_005972 [Monilinia fructicola]
MRLVSSSFRGCCALIDGEGSTSTSDSNKNKLKFLWRVWVWVWVGCGCGCRCRCRCRKVARSDGSDVDDMIRASLKVTEGTKSNEKKKEEEKECADDFCTVERKNQLQEFIV